jgi:hypothetical protein
MLSFYTICLTTDLAPLTQVLTLDCSYWIYWTDMYNNNNNNKITYCDSVKCTLICHILI